MEKYYTSHRKRLEILRDRGMDIPKNSNKQRDIIKKYNYYNLINGYKEPFLEDKQNYPKSANKNEDYYISGTKPEELKALFNFDERIRVLILTHILKIEETLKHTLVQSFYEIHTNNAKKKSTLNVLHRESEYLRRNYYDLKKLTSYQIREKSGYRYTSLNKVKKDNTMENKPSEYTIDGHDSYDKLIARIYSEIGRQRRKSDYIRSYLDNHTYLPMWVLTNILTFGQIGKFYEIQNVDIQNLILKKLNLNDPNMNSEISVLNLQRVIKILTIYRNACAHNERVYCEKISIPIDDAFMNYLDKFPYSNDVKKIKGTNKFLTKSKKRKLNNTRKGLYTLMFCISLFLKPHELKKFKTAFNKELNILSNVLSNRAYNNVLKLMGLNFDWFKKL